jgi:hypothetical protein
MPKVRPTLQRFFILVVASILFGCSTTPPHPKFNVAALALYKKLLLVPVKTEEKLFVENRRWVGSPANATLVSLMDDGYRAYVTKTNKELNDKLSRNMKPELEARLFTLIKQGLTARQVNFVTVEAAATDIILNPHSDELKARLAATLRSKCADCDAALLIDPAFGFAFEGAGKGARAYSGAELLLVSLSDGAIRAKSTASFMDVTSKYDYAFAADVVKDAIRAVEFIPPTVEPLAKAILATASTPQ